MDPLEYLAGASDDWPIYATTLLVSLSLHWFLLLKRRSLGFFDPLFLILLGGAFGWSVVWFMYLRGDIKGIYALSFTASELAFYGGLCVSPRLRRIIPLRTSSNEPPGVAICIFASAALLHVIVTLTVWSIAGIPLFQASRLGAFVGSGGLGIFERLVDSTGMIGLFAALYLVMGNARTRRRFAYYCFFLWYAIATGLSGSKSALLVIGQGVFAVAFLYTSLSQSKNSFWGGRAGRVFIALATGFAVLVLITQQDLDITTALSALAFRMVSFGDIYIYAYPDALIESLRGDNALIGMFGGFLSTFRIFPADLVHVNLGYQLSLLTYPDLAYIAGPNPRHAVFGYHYFGPFAFMFSFVLGLLTSHLQYLLYFRERKDFLRTLLAFLLYSAIVSVSVDFDYSLSRLANVMIALGLILPLAYFLFPCHNTFQYIRPRFGGTRRRPFETLEISKSHGNPT